jgi:hypothetical protein
MGGGGGIDIGPVSSMLMPHDARPNIHQKAISRLVHLKR